MHRACVCVAKRLRLSILTVSDSKFLAMVMCELILKKINIFFQQDLNSD